MPDRILNNVVLPAPFAPIIPMIPPGGNLKLMSSINKLINRLTSESRYFSNAYSSA